MALHKFIIVYFHNACFHGCSLISDANKVYELTSDLISHVRFHGSPIQTRNKRNWIIQLGVNKLNRNQNSTTDLQPTDNTTVFTMTEYRKKSKSSPKNRKEQPNTLSYHRRAKQPDEASRRRANDRFRSDFGIVVAIAMKRNNKDRDIVDCSPLAQLIPTGMHQQVLSGKGVPEINCHYCHKLYSLNDQECVGAARHQGP